MFVIVTFGRTRASESPELEPDRYVPRDREDWCVLRGREDRCVPRESRLDLLILVGVFFKKKSIDSEPSPFSKPCIQPDLVSSVARDGLSSMQSFDIHIPTQRAV